MAPDLPDFKKINAAVEAAGQVRGRHFTEWVPHLDELRKQRRDDESLTLLLEIIAAAERAAAIKTMDPPPGYTKRAAVIYRRQRDHLAEVAILERYLRACPPGRGDTTVSERLAKAKQLADTA
ncbi:hypothetical protein WHI96_19590 [Pseudonocardia tropica]|uniref:Uncharacterized protein n=2 Tax=Pseudonocardia TaxID=1847 RepID=A0ABV1JYI6_9PSEU|nr:MULTISPECIES: hypothetical protein [Pseudonocardia]MYW75183.1 hypothetical protein [Pseudonocardia sp. SID8383]